MKKGFFVVLILFAAVILTACGPAESEFYFASQTPTDTSSWVYWVVIEKKGDKVVDAEWNAFNIEGDANTLYKGLDKVSASEQEIYNMNSTLWWHEQADLVIDKFIKNNGDYNDQIPAPAGVSITTSDFYTLAELALASDPVEKGEYKDGYHFVTLKDNAEPHAEVLYWNPKTEAVVSTGAWDAYSFGSIVVVNGRIVLSYFNNVFYGYKAVVENGAVKKVDHDSNPETPAISIMADYTTETPKLLKTKNHLGTSYGMLGTSSKIGIGKEYFEQAAAAGQYLIANQSFPETNQDGDFDGVAGVSITATDFFDLWKLVPTK
ncbi:hypothetical protein [Acholeplasma granularum]|uniref:hypothetical protein n=1 Tax=Acholeplasma granularum TaxID=264635 RepID=UPI00046F9E21|nr:hypothetical protein [Acholeplasma granularum]